MVGATNGGRVVIELLGPPWRAQGACRDQPAELFYPGRGGSHAAAIAICAQCPVLLECRQWGILHEKHGVWGGTSEHERRRLRRQLGVRCTAPEEAFDDSWRADRALVLWRQGWRIDEIAAELGANTKKVQRWLDAGADTRAVPPPGGRRRGQRMRTA